MKKVNCIIWKDSSDNIHQTVFDKPLLKQYVLLWYNAPGYMEILYLFTIKYKQ